MNAWTAATEAGGGTAKSVLEGVGALVYVLSRERPLNMPLSRKPAYSRCIKL